MAQPMLGDVELQLVQKIDTADDQVFAQHSIPALEGDFLQGIGRRATSVTLTGVITGTEAKEGLKTLRDKFRAAEPVSFVADIATATRVTQVIIEEMGVRELAGFPERFEYALTLREYIPPPPPRRENPPPPPPPPSVDTGTLIVEVIVEGQPNFDFNTVTVTVEGTQEDGTSLSRNLTNRTDNVWTEESMPPGQYTVKAVVSSPQAMSGTVQATIRGGQTEQVSITLRPGVLIAKAFVVHFRFDSAFIEPCLRQVLQQVAEYAENHTSEKLLILGHTDKVGDDLYNQFLSERRGRSVYAFLTFGRDRAAAIAEWNELRKPAGANRETKDNWGVREYQFMLQDWGYYLGKIDEIPGTKTNAAVRAFQGDRGLPVTGIMDDATWEKLVEAYMEPDSFAVPESSFFPNAKDGCDGGILKWLGAGEQDPVKNTSNAWRPNRRTEMLFVQAESIPCDVPQPRTFNKPTPGVVGSSWCLGQDPGNKPESQIKRVCFLTRKEAQEGKWLVQPAEPDKINVSGQITFEDGTPVANAKYVLIAADGEYLDGESAQGRPIPKRADANGNFSYDRQTPVGSYILEVLDVQDPALVRRRNEKPYEAKGTIVCQRLDAAQIPAPASVQSLVVVEEQILLPGAGLFGAIVQPAPVTPPPVTLSITPKSNIVVVKKSYTTPARVEILLKADGPLKQKDVLKRTVTATSGEINFFETKTGGTAITFDHELPANKLKKGVTLFAEGIRASGNLNDVTLTLELTPGPSTAAPATATLTAVELTLDICMSRTAVGVDPAPMLPPLPVAPAPITAIDKWFGGRFVHVQDPANHRKRALLIVRQVQPAAFAGNLVLRQVTIAGDNVTGLDSRAQVFDNELPTGGEAAKANPHEFNTSTIPAAGLRFWVQGRNVSAALRDTGFQLGIKGLENDGDRVAMTVFRINRIEAKLRATPCQRNNTRADVMPAKVSTADSKTFDATAIAVVRECGDLKLTATATPTAVPVTWAVERASDDTGLTGLPTHTADGSDKKRILKTDATGSFHVTAFVNTNLNLVRDIGEDGLILNVTIVNIEILPGAANNQIITRNTLFRDNRSNASFLIVDSGSTGGTAPGVNASYTDAVFSSHPLAMKVTVKLTGGGNNQRRGTDKIGLGYIQQTTADSVTGTYADGRTLREFIAENAGIADPIVSGSPKQLAFPVRDHRGPDLSGTGTFINSSSDSDRSDIATGGQQRIVRYVDPPAIAINRRHPVTNSLLASISGSNNFQTFLCTFSQDFNENYTVFSNANWSITYGTFTQATGWTNVGAQVTAASAMTVPAKPQTGESTDLERCPPGFVDNLKMDAR